ncbi:MAG: NAD(P)/FAD-dependent oxidoreductase [Micavibrio aeruginosavorus]|uniref:NAD(P)/FAD-dependent oxidoreductase n=1 Tax=Micavibrio aeruginosavorus TaxID=349221 RepID=A0A2W5HGK8_9BACT|nr:MAG: NAD(P)/FAD-dependent oxidoreductase [Micavibrio aeruginosavorus]
MTGTSCIECDCLIIGGGPAGLTAAIYLARYRRNVIVVDEGRSRARYIKSSYNYPGFTNGIQGEQLLQNLRTQAEEFGAQIITGKIGNLQKTASGFEASSADQAFRSPKVLLASGVIDQSPSLPNMHEFIYEGAVRFCPICDGYEASDKKIGVLGPLSHIIPKALFLRTYTPDILIFPTDTADLSLQDMDSLRAAQIELPLCCATEIKSSEENVAVILDNGECIEVDVLYPAMGANPRSGLAIALGAGHNEDECLFSDSHQQTSVEGLYIAGDLTTDLSQISVATGQAAIAATHIHNSLPRNFRAHKMLTS